MTTPDLFWETDKKDGWWYTFCPAESKRLGLNLNDCYGKEFEDKYYKMVELAEEGKLEVFSKKKARDVVKHIMRTQFETGLPYVTFFDKLNRDNPNKHEGVIPCFNLCTESTSVLDPYNRSHTCLTGDSLVLTTEGLLPIVDCDNKDVIVPFDDDSGDKFSTPHTENAVLLKKGIQEVFEVSLKSGQKVRATKDHKFLSDSGYVRVGDIKVGDKLRLPKEISNISTKSHKIDIPEARMIGWLLGDGWTREGNIGVCFAPHEHSAQEDVLRTLEVLYGSYRSLSGRDTFPSVYTQPNGVVSWQTKKTSLVSHIYNKYDLEPKLGKDKYLPVNIMTQDNDFKREFLGAIFSADGCVTQPTNERNPSYVAYSSASERLLGDLQNLLIEFGIVANYHYYKIESRGTSQGSLIIKGENNLKNFHKCIGFNLSPEKQSKLEDALKVAKKDTNRKYGTVTSVVLCGEEEVYDLALKDRHHFIANGFVSHNCNLASIVAGRMQDYGDVQKYSALVVEVLDAGIELTSPPTDCSKSHNNSFRTIGTGIQGYHDWLAKEWKDYLDTEEATRFAEHVQYGAVKKSIELAKEKGAYPCFEGSDWDNGVMFDKFESRSVTDLDWNLLRLECQRYGIRNSQLTSPAPNTSTSVFMDAAAGVPPVYSPFFREDNDNGKYPISCMHLKLNPLSYSRSFKTYNQAQLAKTVGAMQLFVDTGISAEYLLDQNKEGFSAKDLYDLLVSAYESGCKATYYIRSLKKGESVEDLLGIKEEGCAGCAG